MAWIRTVDDREAGPELRRCYQSARDPVTGRVDNILKIHSLHPAGLDAHVKLYKTVMRGSAGLPKVDREMIAVVASRVNGCDY